jgi:hypothetical protein
MIKAILTLYAFIPLLILSIFTPYKEVVGFCMAGAFGCGMFGFYFISAHVKGSCNHKGGNSEG